MAGSACRVKRLERLYAYMRLEPQEDLATVELCYDAARAYLKTGGVIDPLDSLPEGAALPRPGQYDLAVNALALHFYDHRDDVGGEAPFSAGLRAIINQLKFGGGSV